MVLYKLNNFLLHYSSSLIKENYNHTDSKFIPCFFSLSQSYILVNPHPHRTQVYKKSYLIAIRILYNPLIKTSVLC